MTRRPNSSRRTATAIRALLMLALLGTMPACSEGTGPEMQAGPNVTGTWDGTFGRTNVRISLVQSGTDVTGTLTAGRRSYSLTGSVDALGALTFRTDNFGSGCDVYSSSRGGLLLKDESTLLEGGATHATGSQPCGNGRVRIDQSTMTLRLAF